MPGSDSENSRGSETSMMLGSAYFRTAAQQPTTTESVERADEIVREMRNHVHPVWALDQQQLLTTTTTESALDPGALFLQYNVERQPHAQQPNPQQQQQQPQSLPPPLPEIQLQDAYEMVHQDMSSGSIFDHVIQMQDGDFNDIDLGQLPLNLGPVPNMRQELINPSSSSDALVDLDVQDRMPTNPRYKTKIACVHCAKNKLGCDLRRPCQRCRDTGKAITCVDRPHVRRRRPQDRHRRNAIVTDDTIEELDSGLTMRQPWTPYSDAARRRGHFI